MSENGQTAEVTSVPSPGEQALQRFNTEVERAHDLRNRVKLKFLGSAGLAGGAVSGAVYLFATGEAPDWAFAAEGLATAGAVGLFGWAQIDLEGLGDANRVAAHLRKSLTVRQLGGDSPHNGDLHPKEQEAQEKLADFRARRSQPLQ